MLLLVVVFLPNQYGSQSWRPEPPPPRTVVFHSLAGLPPPPGQDCGFSQSQPRWTPPPSRTVTCTGSVKRRIAISPGFSQLLEALQALIPKDDPILTYYY